MNGKPSKEQIKEIYTLLLDNFNPNDGEKLDQLEKLNETRDIYGSRTKIWWVDEVEQWINLHKKHVKKVRTQRHPPGLFNFTTEELNQETPNQIHMMKKQTS